MSVKRIYVEKKANYAVEAKQLLWEICLLYTSPSPRDS